MEQANALCGPTRPDLLLPLMPAGAMVATAPHLAGQAGLPCGGERSSGPPEGASCAISPAQALWGPQPDAPPQRAGRAGARVPRCAQQHSPWGPTPAAHPACDSHSLRLSMPPSVVPGQSNRSKPGPPLPLDSVQVGMVGIGKAAAAVQGSSGALPSAGCASAGRTCVGIGTSGGNCVELVADGALS